MSNQSDAVATAPGRSQRPVPSAPRSWRASNPLDAALVGIASFLVFLPGLFWGLPFGKFIVGATVILDGGVPYRDFWSMYAPGAFYLTAAVFRLFGRELLAQGAAVLLIQAASCVVFFLIARRARVPRVSAFVFTALFAGMFWGTAPEVNTYPPLLLLILLAVIRSLRHFETGQIAPLFQAGLFLGVAAWFKHDVAAYATVATAAALLVHHLAEREPAKDLLPVAGIAALAAGAVLGIAPAVVFLALAVGPEAWEQLIVFPATIFRDVRSEPFPPPIPPFGTLVDWARDPGNATLALHSARAGTTWALAYLPALVFIVGVSYVARRWRTLDRTSRSAAGLFLAYLPFFWMAAHVQQNTHVYSMAAFSLLLGAMAWSGVRTASSRTSRTRTALIVALAVYAIGLLLPSAEALARFAIWLPESRALDLPGAMGVRVRDQVHETHVPIAQWVRDHVPPHEPIYVGVQRHDAIVICAMQFYYLMGRPGCTRYYELHPGVSDTRAAQEETIQALERDGVRCVLLWQFGWSDETLDMIKSRREGAAEGIGSRILDEYLAETFEPVLERGEFVVLWRRGEQTSP